MKINNAELIDQMLFGRTVGAVAVHTEHIGLILSSGAEQEQVTSTASFTLALNRRSQVIT